jgi:hypothetical protein
MKLESRILKRTNQDLRETPPWIVETLRNNEKMKVGIKMKELKENSKKIIDWWEFILTSRFEGIWEQLRKKLEESGKILGKDLWVRAHSKETPLEWMLEKRYCTGWFNWHGWGNNLELGWTEKKWNTNLLQCLQHSGRNEIMRGEQIIDALAWENIW